MNKKVLVLDYKTGNVDSVVKAVNILGYEAIFSSKKSDFDKVQKIILPGQGAYNFAMQKLNEDDILENIKKKIDEENLFVLGICLGMQILSTIGIENNKTKGLNLIEGEVKIMKNRPNKLPHIGWNTVKFLDENENLFKDIQNEKDFYFIHSYYFSCKKSSNIIATTKFNEEFPSIVKNNSIYGVQFHPEKSLKSGIKLFENFLKLK